MESGELVEAFSLLSPSTILVGFIAILFLLTQAWPYLSRQNQVQGSSALAPTNSERSSQISVSKEPDVPEGWWSGHDAFELERRAIFSKTWIYLAHRSQLTKAGAYQSFDIAGFPIFLIRGKDDKIRAFHNVCRHRAYTITRKESGATTVLGCRYHGWSYDTRGHLVKAPQFDDVPGFDKSQNGLFEIHAHTTEHGWVFVNLDAGEPSPFNSSTSSSLRKFANAARLSSRDTWVTGQTLRGAFNWKLGLSPRHNEVLKTTLEERASEVLAPSMVTRAARIITQKRGSHECLLSPGTLIYSFENVGIWLALTFLPSSATTTQVRYDLFKSSDCNAAELSKALEDTVRNLTQQIESEFQSLAETPGSTNQLSGEIDWNTTGTPRLVLDRIQEHAKLEKKRGAQISPAMRQPKASSLFQKAEQVCKELDCIGGGSQNATLPSGSLAW
ncbi:hypothetical protein N7510_005934 [Penicillium lagena]|uniref:uncharacterized protein n=1 Tax=Penicillium lagena TaxID=94218 RepID=UPI0025423ADA|nr:uncharacterized protein N7510_005934 [Penicillium lagena]KAJ5612740.1 hypothetical protein N7510_005934 [Penicillium lagena]